MQPVPATVPERLSIAAAACSDAAEITDMTPLASLVPSDRHIMFDTCNIKFLNRYNLIDFYYVLVVIEVSLAV